MILPSDETCRRVIKELQDDPGLTQWEGDWIDSNLYREKFSDAQRQVVVRLMEKFEI